MRTATHRAIVISIALALLVVGLSSPGSASQKKDLQRKRSKVSGKINSARNDLSHSTKKLQAAVRAYETAQGELRSAEQHLRTTRGKLSVARVHDAQMQQQLNQAEHDLKQAEVDLGRGEKRVRKSEDEVKQFAIESLQNPDRGMKAFAELLDGASPREFTERLALTQSVSDAQGAKLDRLDATRVILATQRDTVKRLRNDVAMKRASAAKNLEVMKTLEAKAKTQQASVSDLVDRRSQAKGKASRARAEDEAQLRELEQQRRRLESQIRGLSKTKAGKKKNTDRSSRLAKPVSGYITSHFGYRIHPISKVRRLHAGTDFGAPCGRSVHAAASGTIVSAGWAGGYGNRIVVNHGRMKGKNITTTYNHLSGYVRRSGRVSRGQTIGRVGTTGSSTGCHLHFEVLVNGSFTNPLNWL